jgi:hypothetical protein
VSEISLKGNREGGEEEDKGEEEAEEEGRPANIVKVVVSEAESFVGLKGVLHVSHK